MRFSNGLYLFLQFTYIISGEHNNILLLICSYNLLGITKLFFTPSAAFGKFYLLHCILSCYLPAHCYPIRLTSSHLQWHKQNLNATTKVVDSIFFLITDSNSLYQNLYLICSLKFWSTGFVWRQWVFNYVGNLWKSAWRMNIPGY